jgi:DNA-binding PadR family transcriptional regulator
MSPETPTRDPIPLKIAWFHILLALADGPQHGYAIRAAVEERTDGRVKLWPATLYGAIRSLEEEELILETDGAVDPGDDDARRRYYRLTPLGRTALLAEVDRLQALVATALASRALRGA